MSVVHSRYFEKALRRIFGLEWQKITRLDLTLQAKDAARITVEMLVSEEQAEAVIKCLELGVWSEPDGSRWEWQNVYVSDAERNDRYAALQAEGWTIMEFDVTEFGFTRLGCERRVSP